MPRPQFSLKTLLWLMLVVAAFLGGMVLQRKLDEPVYISKPTKQSLRLIVPEVIELRDGTRWYRFAPHED
jgi:hypothetical protein